MKHTCTCTLHNVAFRFAEVPDSLAGPPRSEEHGSVGADALHRRQRAPDRSVRGRGSACCISEHDRRHVYAPSEQLSPYQPTYATRTDPTRRRQATDDGACRTLRPTRFAMRHIGHRHHEQQPTTARELHRVPIAEAGRRHHKRQRQ